MTTILIIIASIIYICIALGVMALALTATDGDPTSKTATHFLFFAVASAIWPISIPAVLCILLGIVVGSWLNGN